MLLRLLHAPILPHGRCLTRAARRALGQGAGTAFDVVRARQDFPALAEGLAHFDGPGGTQVPVGAPSLPTSTVAFTVAGRAPQQVMADLGAQGACFWTGDDDAVELMRSLGLADSGGAVRAGVVCCTTAQEVDRLLACL